MLTIAPWKSIVANVANAEMCAFTAAVVDEAIRGIPPAIGHLVGPRASARATGCDDHGRRRGGSARIEKVVDLGVDPVVGGHQVLLDGVTPAWGEWSGDQFEIHKTQRFPGLDEPTEGLPPPGYGLVVAEQPAIDDGTVLIIAIAALLAALGVASFAVRMLRSSTNTLPRPTGSCPGTTVLPRARALNIAVVDAEGSLLPKSAALALSTPYQVRIDIGPRSSESVLDNPSGDAEQSFYTGGFWLDVLVVSPDLDITAALHRLYLPGLGWVCGCSGAEHTCSPDDRRPYLYVPVSTRKEQGRAHPQMHRLPRQHVVQSARLEVATGQGPAGSAEK